jgi:hypothetical protein
MEWSHSKVIRIENGEVSISPNDLRPLLNHLGVKDRTVIADLVANARVARTRQRQAWYQAPRFREHLNPTTLRLIDYEIEATAIRSYSVYYPPGILQTPAYASALTFAWKHDIPEQKLAAVVEARRRRHELVVNRLGSMQIFLVLDQSVFERQIGGPGVLADQLQQLHDLAAGELISMRMLSFDSNTPLANNGSFDLLAIGDDSGDEILYRESGTGDELIEDAATTAKHRERFEQLWQVATTEVDTINFIKGRIEALRAKAGGAPK